jgi:DNA-binding beta-propeller fold protein YncE
LIYAVAISGDAGSGRPNPNAILMGLAGVQGSALSQIQLNELTSAATVSQMKSLIRMSACNSISGNSGDATGSLCPVINGQAQSNWSTWVSAAAGLVNAGSGQVSTSNSNDIGLLNLQASVLANCINSSGLTSAHTACGDLYSAATIPIGTLGSTVATQNYPKQLAVSPDGRYLYVVNYGTSSVSSYQISAGQLTWINNTSTGMQPVSIAISPDGLYAQVVNVGDNSISSYRINAGALSPVVGGDLTASTHPTDASPQRVVISHDGAYVFVSNAGGSISVYESHSGVLTETASSPFALSVLPFDLVISPDDQHLYATLYPLKGLIALRHASGVLTEMGTYSASAGTKYMAMSPDGRFLYVTNDYYQNPSLDQAKTSVFAVQSGVLTETAGSPFNVGAYPRGVAVSPDGTQVAITNPATKSLELYQSNQGRLSLIETISNPLVTQHAMFSANGQYLFVTASNTATAPGSVLVYSLPSTPNNTLSALVNMQTAPTTTAAAIYPLAPSPLVFAPIPASAPASLSLP